MFEDGVFEGYSGASLDVTDDIRHRHRLEDIERLFESVTEAGPLAVLRTDAVGRVLYANGRWAGLLDDPDVRLTGLGWRARGRARARRRDHRAAAAAPATPASRS